MVQFHQSYSYEDFIQGYRPEEGGGFQRRDGIFHQFCGKAAGDEKSNYVFIIDEINRGNLSKIFGELLMLIEADKRGRDFSLPLTYAKDQDDRFFIPENLHIIGMMNTADRSLAMVDYALRRRFTFIDLRPEFTTEDFRSFLEEHEVDQDVIETIVVRMVKLNDEIRTEKTNLGPGFEIGHSFFCPQGTEEELGMDWYRSVIRAEIAPLLREYWFDDLDKAEERISELLK
jgi:5-methylcytosine-specific restriction protein B